MSLKNILFNFNCFFSATLEACKFWIWIVKEMVKPEMLIIKLLWSEKRLPISPQILVVRFVLMFEFRSQKRCSIFPLLRDFVCVCEKVPFCSTVPMCILCKYLLVSIDRRIQLNWQFDFVGHKSPIEFSFLCRMLPNTIFNWFIWTVVFMICDRD